MTAARTDARPIYCDGCGQQASAEHLRHRIARLEWASRFRPVRIGTLFLIPAPPAGMEDFFYFPEGKARDPKAQALYEDLLHSCGIAQSVTDSRETVLRAFQQAGYFLTECIECPAGSSFSEDGELDALLGRVAPTLERRIRFSYRPEAILPISDRLTPVAKALSAAGLEARLLLRDDRPVSVPNASDTSGRARFRAEMTSLLAGSGAQSA